MKKILIAAAIILFTGTAYAENCSQFPRESRLNPTTLSDYQKCVINKNHADKPNGRVGNLVWVRVGNDLFTITNSELRKQKSRKDSGALLKSRVKEFAGGKKKDQLEGFLKEENKRMRGFTDALERVKFASLYVSKIAGENSYELKELKHERFRLLNSIGNSEITMYAISSAIKDKPQQETVAFLAERRAELTVLAIEHLKLILDDQTEAEDYRFEESLAMVAQNLRDFDALTKQAEQHNVDISIHVAAVEEKKLLLK